MAGFATTFSTPDGKKFDIGDEDTNAFRSDFPDAKRMLMFQTDDGKKFDISEEDAGAFMSDFPNAKQVVQYRFDDGGSAFVPLWSMDELADDPDEATMQSFGYAGKRGGGTKNFAKDVNGVLRNFKYGKLQEKVTNEMMGRERRDLGGGRFEELPVLKGDAAYDEGAFKSGIFNNAFDEIYKTVNGRRPLLTVTGQEAKRMIQAADQMNDAEVGTFNFLAKTKGEDEARKYLRHILPELNARHSKHFTKNVEDFAKAHPVAASAVSVLGNIGRVAELPTIAADKLAGLEIDPNSAAFDVGRGSDTARSTVSESFDSKTSKFIYDATMSIVDNVANMAVSGGFGGVANAAASGSARAVAAAVAKEAVSKRVLSMMGTEAAMGTVLEAKQRGLSDEQALGMGIAYGAIEVATEKLPLDNLLAPKVLRDSILKVFAKQVGQEAAEEFIAEWADAGVDALIARDKSEIAQKVKEYEAAGKSRSEAVWGALRDKMGDAAMAGLAGAFSGAVMGAGATAAQANSRVKTGNRMDATFRNTMLNTVPAEAREHVTPEMQDLIVGEASDLHSSGAANLTQEQLDAERKSRRDRIEKEGGSRAAELFDRVNEALGVQSLATSEEFANVNADFQRDEYGNVPYETRTDPETGTVTQSMTSGNGVTVAATQTRNGATRFVVQGRYGGEHAIDASNIRALAEQHGITREQFGRLSANERVDLMRQYAMEQADRCAKYDAASDKNFQAKQRFFESVRDGFVSGTNWLPAFNTREDFIAYVNAQIQRGDRSLVDALRQGMASYGAEQLSRMGIRGGDINAATDAQILDAASRTNAGHFTAESPGGLKTPWNYIILDNTPTPVSVMAAVLHETRGHGVLDEVFGSDNARRAEFLNAVRQSVPEELAEKLRRLGLNGADSVSREELFSYVNQLQVGNPTAYEKVVHRIHDFLNRNLGARLITDSDVKVLIEAEAQNINERYHGLNQGESVLDEDERAARAARVEGTTNRAERRSGLSLPFETADGTIATQRPLENRDAMQARDDARDDAAEASEAATEEWRQRGREIQTDTSRERERQRRIDGMVDALANTTDEKARAKLVSKIVSERQALLQEREEVRRRREDEANRAAQVAEGGEEELDDVFGGGGVELEDAGTAQADYDARRREIENRYANAVANAATADEMDAAKKRYAEELRALDNEGNERGVPRLKSPALPVVDAEQEAPMTQREIDESVARGNADVERRRGEAEDFAIRAGQRGVNQEGMNAVESDDIAEADENAAVEAAVAELNEERVPRDPETGAKVTDEEAHGRRVAAQELHSRATSVESMLRTHFDPLAEAHPGVYANEGFRTKYAAQVKELEDAIRVANPARVRRAITEIGKRMSAWESQQRIEAENKRRRDEIARRREENIRREQERKAEQERRARERMSARLRDEQNRRDEEARQNALRTEEEEGVYTGENADEALDEGTPGGVRAEGFAGTPAEAEAEAAKEEPQPSPEPPPPETSARPLTPVELLREEAIRTRNAKDMPIFSEEDAANRRKMKFNGRLMAWRRASSISSFARRYGDGDILLTYFKDGLMYPQTPKSEGYDAYRQFVDGVGGDRNRRRLLHRHNPHGLRGGLDATAMEAAEVFGRPEYAEVGGAEKLIRDYMDQFAEYDEWVRRGAPSLDEEMNDQKEIDYWVQLREEQEQELAALPELERAYADIDELYANAEATIGVYNERTGVMDYYPVAAEDFSRIQPDTVLQWNGMELAVENVLADGSLLVYNQGGDNAGYYILIGKNGVGEQNGQQGRQGETADGRQGEGASGGRGNPAAASEGGVLRSRGGWEARRVSNEAADAVRSGNAQGGEVAGSGRSAPAFALESATQEQLNAEAAAREEKARAARRAEREATERDARLNVGARDAQDLDAEELPLGTDTAGDLFSHAAQRRAADRNGRTGTDAAKFSVTPEQDAAYTDSAKRGGRVDVSKPYTVEDVAKERPYLKVNQATDGALSDSGQPEAALTKPSVAAARQSLDSLVGIIANRPQKAQLIFGALKKALANIENGKPIVSGGKFLSAKNFVTTMQVLGFNRKPGADSAYLVIGGDAAVRASDHSANAELFIQDGTDNNLSVVIRRPHSTAKRFNADTSAHVVEAVYTRADLDAHPEKLPYIVRDIAEFIATGEYHDTAGAMAYNYSGSEEYKAAARDRIYSDALARGDMKVAERMVREAAARAMPDTKVVGEDGLPLVLYHGSNRFGTTVFNGSFFLTDSENRASGYGGPGNGASRGFSRRREIGRPEPFNPENTGSVVRHAKSVLGLSLHEATVDEKSKAFDEIAKQAMSFNERMNKLDGWPDYSSDEEFEFANKVQSIAYAFLVDESDWESLKNAVLNDGARGVLADQFRKDLDDVHDRYYALRNEYETKRDSISEGFRKFCDGFFEGYDTGDFLADVEFKLGNLLDPNNDIAREDGTIINRKSVVDQIVENRSSGIYSFFVQMGDNPLVVDAKGAYWSNIDFNGTKMSTDSIAKWARDNGYTSVRINNVQDPGVQNATGNDFITFNSNQVKSADAVTYDDAGNVIPLSQRFNPKRDDVRFSMGAEQDTISNEGESNGSEENADALGGEGLRWARRTVDGGGTAGGGVQERGGVGRGHAENGPAEFLSAARRDGYYKGDVGGLREKTPTVRFPEGVMEKSGARFSIGKVDYDEWNAILDRYESGELKTGEMLTVWKSTPSVLLALGTPNLPITIDKQVIDKITGVSPTKSGERHSIPLSELRNIQIELDNPIAVFDSRSGDNSFVILTRMVDRQNNEKAVVVLRTDVDRGAIRINPIASTYGKDKPSIENWMAWGLLRYVNKQARKSSARWLQLPSDSDLRAHSVLTEKDFSGKQLGEIVPQSGDGVNGVDDTETSSSDATSSTRFSMASSLQDSDPFAEYANPAPSRLTPTGSTPATAVPSPDSLKAFMDSEETWADRQRRKFQDLNIDLKRMEERAKTASGGPVTEKESVYYAEDRRYGIDENRVRMLWHERLDPIFKEMAENGLTQEDVDDYLYAKHGPTRNKMIRERRPGVDDGSGWSDEKCAKVLARLDSEGKTAALESVAKKVWDLNHWVIENKVKAGLLARQQADTWLALSPEYVPLRNVDAGGMDTMDTAIMRRESRHAIGRKKEADSPLNFSIQQAVQSILREDKNAVRQKLLALVRANPDMGKVLAQQPTEKRYDPRTGMVRDMLDMDFGEKSEGNVVQVKENGQLYYIQLNGKMGEMVARAVTKRGLHNWGDELSFVPDITRTMANLRTSWVPTFLFRNFLNDNTQVLANMSADGLGKEAAQFEKNFFKMRSSGAIDSWIKTGKASGPLAEYAKEWTENGGMIGGQASMGYGDVQHDINKRLRKALKSPSQKARLVGAVEAMGDYFQRKSESVESGTRLAVYAALRQSGVPVEKAISYSRDVTVNFNRKGEWTPILNSLFMFSNASIQDMERTLRSLSNKEAARLGRNGAGKRALAAFFALGLVRSFVSHMLAGKRDDDETDEAVYENIPEFRKRGTALLALGRDGKTVSLPMRGLRAVPDYIGQKVGDMLFGGEDPSKAAVEIAGMLAQSATDMAPSSATPLQSVSPTVLQPLVQLAEGKTWTGDDLYKFTMPGDTTPDSSQGKRNTPETYKKIAKGINRATGGSDYESGFADFRPESVQTVAEAVFAGVLSDITKASDAVAGAKEFVTTGRTDLTVDKTPVLRDIVRNVPDNTSRYYEAKEAHEKVAGILERMRKGKTTGPERDEFMNKNPSTRSSVSSRLKKLGDTIKKVYDAEREETDAEKRDYLHQRRIKLQAQYLDLAKAKGKGD